MRVVWALAALALLSGCGDLGPKPPAQEDADLSSAAGAAAFASTGTGFDYRYAFRLPANRVKGVLQSNADACDRLGPARCRILSMRYRVDGANRIRAVLTINADPVIARAYGDAVTRNVTGADGVLVDTEIAGTDSTASARSAAVIRRLQDQLQNARAGTSPDAQARAARLQSALATIAEVEASQGETLANAPVLITYESSTALTSLGSSDANFRNAGEMFENSVSQVAQALANVGPWLLLMVVVVLILRWIIHGRAVPEREPEAEPEPASRGDRNLIHRWFSRDEEEETERAQ